MAKYEAEETFDIGRIAYHLGHLAGNEASRLESDLSHRGQADKIGFTR